MLRSLNGKAGRCLWSGLLLLILALPASAQNKMSSDREIPKQSPKEIRLSLEQIPTPPASLPVFRLSAQKPPIEFVQETLRRADTQAGKLVPLTEVPQLFP